MIKIIDGAYEKFKFPCGELQVRITKPLPLSLGYRSDNLRVDVDFIFEDSSEILELLLVCNALKHLRCSLGSLYLPYVPFGRQDRVAVRGECFSLEVFADLINGLGFDRVFVYDPHSDVTTALIKNCIVLPQHEIFAPMFREKKDFWLVSPDGGALKKIYKLAEIVDSLGVVECSKLRDVKTGEIKGVVVHAEDLQGKDCYIVDDILDKGGTFVAISKELKRKNCGKIILMVTHGFFNAGFDPFVGLIDEIYIRTGRVK